MSVSELMQLYQMYDRNGVRNINCGYLRSIGKTECLKEMIRNQRPIGVMPIVLVPSRDMGMGYNNIICRTIPLSDLYELRGFPLPCNIYADEVPNAEEIVNDFHRTDMRFIAGFYSIPVTTRPLPQTRTLNATWSIDNEEMREVIREWQGQNQTMRYNRVPRYVDPMPSPVIDRDKQPYDPTIKPVKHIKTTIKMVKKNIKLKFIGK